MKEYLVWVNYGGEYGSPERLQGFYKVCTGNSMDEVILDWATQNEFSMKDIRQNEKYWAHHGRQIVTFKLIESNGYEDWKSLKWS